MKEMDFPITWDSETLEGAIPGLCDEIGYDKNLSAKISNHGAPRFLFQETKMSIEYSMDVDVFDEHYDKWYLTMTMHNITIDFDVQVDNMTLLTHWNSIQMSHAEISKSEHTSNLDNDFAQRTMTDYFNNVWIFVLPWVNEFHPMNINKF